MQPNAIGLFYGSTTGNTEDAAHEIAQALCARGDTPVKLFDITGMNPERLLEFDRLVLGCPTWDVGELQSDWECLLRRLGDLRLDGKRVALFGSGDAACYPETFQDAMGILGAALRARGATLVGSWPTEGYVFEASRGVENRRFLGLALDIADSRSLVRQRVCAWVEQLLREFSAP